MKKFSRQQSTTNKYFHQTYLNLLILDLLRISRVTDAPLSKFYENKYLYIWTGTHRCQKFSQVDLILVATTRNTIYINQDKPNITPGQKQREK